MNDDFSTVDARQLEVWAFGRHGNTIDRERAESALRELRRRADAARVEAERHTAEGETAERLTAAAQPPGDGESAGEHPEPSARHRHRMLRTGQAGVVAALLAIGAGGVALSLPDPDPFAVFDRAPTEEELGWQSLLENSFGSVITLGPRVVDLDDSLAAIVFRSAAVADGRSTAYDPYCIVVSDGSEDPGRSIVNGACVLPERLSREGFVLPLRPAKTGSGYELAAWGPQGGPRLETVESLDGIGEATSVLDWMIYPTSQTDATQLVDDPAQLLLGPATVPLLTEGEITPNVTTVASLLQARIEGADPLFCVRSIVPEEGATEVCAPLATVRRDGLEYTVTAEGRAWVVSIGADGPQRADGIRSAD